MYWCEYCQKAEEPVQKREEQYHDEVDTRNYEVTYIDVCPDCGHELYLTADECPICGEFKDARHVGEATVSRLVEMCEILMMNGKDYRFKK